MSKPSNSSPQPQQFDAAFCHLQSVNPYTRPQRPKPKSNPKPSMNSTLENQRSGDGFTHTITFPGQTKPTPQPKNYEAAFGNLSSSYGFAAGSSILPKKDQGTCEVREHKKSSFSISSLFKSKK